MTKLIEIGKNQNNQTKVPIVFDYYLCDLKFNEDSFQKTCDRAENFEYVELICRNYLENKDLMFAYDDENNRREGTLFVGNWNDGVIDCQNGETSLP